MSAPVLEMAVLDVRPGREQEFEAAFAEAKSIIAASHGFQGLELRHCVERENRYLLLISWATLDDHVVGFRQGPDYPRWKALLHHFYDPHPTVAHFTPVAEA
jgi:heme-degrading monooxygenase HmoA